MTKPFADGLVRQNELTTVIDAGAFAISIEYNTGSQVLISPTRGRLSAICGKSPLRHCIPSTSRTRRR
ncbi:MAG: hypothetical protein BJ554DRAFT_113 [Olpidium bornovanus]|uniref:Uncharacterized protein n=1 Tax=Olpidium bornovanus TaxID=278681 RepID=A0A8H8A1P8_9FUNG|nr:MAG: hypothetical protein BJ554DRAFT_113 [Olpidium bornovanus]